MRKGPARGVTLKRRRVPLHFRDCAFWLHELRIAISDLRWCIYEGWQCRSFREMWQSWRRHRVVGAFSRIYRYDTTERAHLLARLSAHDARYPTRRRTLPGME
jgi:hypothetical protein